MTVGIFTPRSVNPLHPRLVAYRAFFESEKIEYEIHNFSDQTGQEFSIKNWLNLWFFDWNAVKRCKPLVVRYDVVFVTDMKYLPLVRHANRAGKKVVYETIDHNVYLRFYQLEKRFIIFRPFKKWVTSYFKRREQEFVNQYCHEVIVNSDALRHYLGKKTTILFYSSPFEKSGVQNSSSKPTALIYLGAFTADKGAWQTISLARQLNLPLHVFGPIADAKIEHACQSLGIHHTPKVAVPELMHRLKELMSRYFLIGISLIEAAHHSYEVQEANKDIDYMALGIPIIGNSRKPTADKINQGCGWYSNDIKLDAKISNKQELEQCSMQCVRIYNTHYASQHFNKTLQALWHRLA
jgi:hypothetical protein